MILVYQAKEFLFPVGPDSLLININNKVIYKNILSQEVQPSASKKLQQFIIFIPASNLKKLQQIVRPHMTKTMFYKIGL